MIAKPTSSPMPSTKLSRSISRPAAYATGRKLVIATGKIVLARRSGASDNDDVVGVPLGRKSLALDISP